MLRCIGQEIRKNCYLPYLLLAVFGVLFLCLTAEGEIDNTGKSITIFALMFQNRTPGSVSEITKSGLLLWEAGIGGWLVVFVPLLLSFGYIALLSGERQNGQTRFHLIRSGNFRYCVSKVAGGALFGGMVFLIGYALFGLLMAAAFPAFSGFPPEEQSWYLEMYFGNSIPLYIVKRLVGAFLYGMFGSAFGIGVAIVFRDKYMLLCLPFLINYIYQQVLGKMMTDRFAAGAESVDWLEALRLESILRVSADKYWAITVILMAAVYAGLTVLFYLNVKRGNWGG